MITKQTPPLPQKHLIVIQSDMSRDSRRERENAMGNATIHTDGACSGNPGPGGWAAIIVSDGLETVIAGGEKNTTNNRMELTGVIRALEEIKKRRLPSEKSEVYTDSQYVKKGITDWIKKWVVNGWKNSSNDPVKNQDLWKKLLALTDGMALSWHWIKGHADNAHNNRCDELARNEILKLK
jgi:ribonuclease HI